MGVSHLAGLKAENINAVSVVMPSSGHIDATAKRCCVKIKTKKMFPYF